MPKRDLLPWIILLSKFVSDLIIIAASFSFAYFIKFRSLLSYFAYYKLLITVTVIWIIIFNMGGLYKSSKKEGKRGDGLVATSFAITSAAFITLLITLFLYKEAAYATGIVFYAWIITLVLINISRTIIWQISKNIVK